VLGTRVYFAKTDKTDRETAWAAESQRRINRSANCAMARAPPSSLAAPRFGHSRIQAIVFGGAKLPVSGQGGGQKGQSPRPKRPRAGVGSLEGSQPLPVS